MGKYLHLYELSELKSAERIEGIGKTSYALQPSIWKIMIRNLLFKKINVSHCDDPGCEVYGYDYKLRYKILNFKFNPHF